jgi:hypothetical protein
MSTKMEKRVFTAARIANYGLRAGLLPYQIDEAVGIGMTQLDAGYSMTTAYEIGRKVVDTLAQKQIIFQA